LDTQKTMYEVFSMDKEKGILKAVSYKTKGILLDMGGKETWYDAKTVFQFIHPDWKGGLVECIISEDKVTYINYLGYDEKKQTHSGSPAPAKTYGKSPEDSKRISRQACLNTAVSIVELSIKMGFVETVDDGPVGDKSLTMANMVKTIAEDLEGWVYRD
jgi:hypothetical protein